MGKNHRAKVDSIPAWGKVLLWAIGIGVVLGVPLIGALVLTLGNIENKLTSIEDVIYVLAEEHPEKTRDLIDKLLAQAKEYASDGNIEWAGRILGTTDILLAQAHERNIEIDDKDYKRWAGSVEEMWKREDAWEGPMHLFSLSLARYSSSLKPVPTIASDAQVIEFPFSSVDDLVKNLQGQATVLDGRKMPPGEDFFRVGPPLQGTLADNVYIIGVVFRGASQTLDGIHWQNTTFVETHIKYTGGELDLNNVGFVNCTFEIPVRENGIRLAQHIALGSPSLTITSPAMN